MDPELRQKLDDWYSWCRGVHAPSYESVKSLEDRGDFDTLRKCFNTRLVFGTAGIRGKMGPGISQLNDVVIIQTSQGLAEYVRSCHTEDSKAPLLVVIGYDARHNSKRWANLAAGCFKRAGFQVLLFSDITPTPWVPYTVLRKQANCGIMITASHNPKDDNGYKVYWNTGAQIIPPHDRNIAESILKNLLPQPGSFELLEKSDFIDPLEESSKAYYDDLVMDLYDKEGLNKCAGNPRIVYTAMHGVGANYIDRAFSVCGFAMVIHVTAQREPDPDFPTVAFPNPEEGKCALNLSIETAQAQGIKYILANDPDADRLAIAEKLSSGSWKVFTGNEIGTLLGWWLMTAHLHGLGNTTMADKNRLHFIASTVSSKMLRSIAQKESMNFHETLTGFKWMCHKVRDVEKSGQGKVLLAYEEAIGFMCGSRVLDKDGVSAAIRAAELIAYLNKERNGMSLNEKLAELYRVYGYHCGKSNYFKICDPDVLSAIFKRLRRYDENQEQPNYPKTLDTSQKSYKITSVRDLTTGYDSSQPDKKAVLPVSSDSHMVTFTLENGTVMTIRNSGTEPKLKYYVEYCGRPEQENWELIRQEMDAIVEALIDNFIQPKKYGAEANQ